MIVKPACLLHATLLLTMPACRSNIYNPLYIFLINKMGNCSTYVYLPDSIGHAAHEGDLQASVATISCNLTSVNNTVLITHHHHHPITYHNENTHYQSSYAHARAHTQPHTHHHSPQTHITITMTHHTHTHRHPHPCTHPSTHPRTHT